MKTTTKLWIWAAVLVFLTPLGLIFPDHFKAGSAWGEWGTGGIAKITGYVPSGMEKLSGLWNAPMPAYAFKGWEEKGLAHLSIAYILSALIGIAVISGLIVLIGKILFNKEKR